MSTTEQQFEALLNSNKSLSLTLAVLEPAASAMVRNAMLLVYVAGITAGVRESEVVVRRVLDLSNSPTAP